MMHSMDMKQANILLGLVTRLRDRVVRHKRTFLHWTCKKMCPFFINIVKADFAAYSGSNSERSSRPLSSMFMDMELPDFQSRSNDSKNELISSTLDVFGDMCRWLFVRLFFFYLLQVVHSCKCSKKSQQLWVTHMWCIQTWWITKSSRWCRLQ